jgi:endonuclease/exonuclease/phosphatase family metal-dependent hydrolase
MTALPPVTPAARRPATRSRLRGWSIGALALGTLLGGTALAVGGGARKSDEYGQMGISPMPVVSTVSGPTSFRVSSFNVLGADHTAGGKHSKKGYADGELRMKWAVQLLKSHQVDVVGLQEFQPPQYDKWLRKATPLYDIFPGYLDTVGFLRNSIAWRKDKFRLVSASWIKLPYFHGDVLRMPVVLLQSLQTGQQIYFMNFQNPADVRGNADKWRRIGQRLQIRLVNQLRASNALPIIWTGDMNSKGQVFCRVTKQASMVSASGGYRSQTQCHPPRKMVVDWIFGSQVQFSNYVQDRSRKVMRTSDHHLLTADVLVQPAEPIIPPPPIPTVTTTPTLPPPTVTLTPSPPATTPVGTTGR